MHPTKVKVKLLSHVRTLCDPMGYSLPSMGFSRQEYWSFSFSIIPSKEVPGLISSRMDCLDLLAVQGTLKSLLQHHNSKASILQRSAFFTVQLSHPYMTTGKTIALTRRTFVGKVIANKHNSTSKYILSILLTQHRHALKERFLKE